MPDIERLKPRDKSTPSICGMGCGLVPGSSGGSTDSRTGWMGVRLAPVSAHPCARSTWFAIAKASVKETAGKRRMENSTWEKNAAFSADTSGSAKKKCVGLKGTIMLMNSARKDCTCHCGRRHVAMEADACCLTYIGLTAGGMHVKSTHHEQLLKCSVAPQNDEPANY
jgi:hypothetical protein